MLDPPRETNARLERKGQRIDREIPMQIDGGVEIVTHEGVLALVPQEGLAKGPVALNVAIAPVGKHPFGSFHFPVGHDEIDVGIFAQREVAI
jgi:hypothetical protein